MTIELITKGSEAQCKWANDIVGNWLKILGYEIESMECRIKDGEDAPVIKAYLDALIVNKNKIIEGCKKVKASQVIDMKNKSKGHEAIEHAKKVAWGE